MSDPLWTDRDDLADAWSERTWVTETWSATDSLTDGWTAGASPYSAITTDELIMGDDFTLIIGDDDEHIEED